MKPVRATNHCRHYSYETGLDGRGPFCARGIDLSAPAAWLKCAPEPTGRCDQREEYTDDERTAWIEYRNRRIAMVGEAVAAIPDQLPPMSEGNCPCPHCDGLLRYTRSGNGHVWLGCSTADCVGPVHFNVPADKAWPSKVRP